MGAMIPKILHYCWFGNKDMPDTFTRFIEGWKEKMPDYQIVCWNEKNAPTHLPYLQTALANQNWANASNLVRLWAVYQQGGIYLDTDVEMTSSLDAFTSLSCFFGKEKDEERIYVNNAVFGAVKGHWFVGKCIEQLQLQFDGREAANLSSPIFTTRLLEKYSLITEDDYQLVADIHLFPSKVFHPYSWFEKGDKKVLDAETHTIHHYAKTWEKKSGNTGLKFFQKLFHHTPASFQDYIRYGSLFLKIQREKKVMMGPFSGIQFAALKAHGSSVFPKLIGSYESCLHPVWYRLQLNTYDKIIHFGAGEGYYVMGLQKLFLPTLGSVAYESDTRNVALLQQNLSLNGITNSVRINPVSVTALNAGEEASGFRCCVVCDIEGGEKEIFNPHNVAAFSRSDLVVELHEFMDRNMLSTLAQLFEASHQIEIINEHTMPAVARQFMKMDRRSRNLLQLIDEGRPEPMRWALFTAK